MKKVFTYAFLLFSIVTFSQKDFTGKAVYMSKTTMDMDNFGGRQFSEQQKKQIKERMKSTLEKTFTLNFNKSESLYKENEKLEAPGGGGRGFRFGGLSGGGTKYKNSKDNVALESTEFFGKQFLISDDMSQPKWELGSESKQIGNYTAFKATMLKEVDPADFSNFRRGPRGNNNKDEAKKDSTNKASGEIKKPEKVLVTAWFTPQIPVGSGPGEYWGLPGLILEVSTGRTTILCTEIVINPTGESAISKPTKGKEITREKYNEVVKVKMEEMRERFSGRGGNGRGGRGR